MEETKLTGSLNVEKPVLYILSAREGDCALLTFNGYSMLVNGGYDRVNPSFWRFASMLKHIDSALMTNQDTDAIAGLSSWFAKKLVQPNIKPNIFSVFGNLVKSKTHVSIRNDADVISEAIDELKLKIQPLVKHDQSTLRPHQQPEHINLYFKHEYGSLDMYVLSPFANSAEYRELVNQTHAEVQSNVHKSNLKVNQTFKHTPVSHLCSAVVLFSWTPNKVGENAVRILFTGNAPQHVIALDEEEEQKRGRKDSLSENIFKFYPSECEPQHEAWYEVSETSQNEVDINQCGALIAPIHEKDSTPTTPSTLEFKDYQFAKTEMENKQNYIIKLNYENELSKHKEESIVKIQKLQDSYQQNIDKIVS